jgi:O-methyltransferase involved in polyketide biosynthesis
MTAPSDGDFPELDTGRPSPARVYDYTIGGKDHFEVDRAAALTVNALFPEGVDAGRSNRLFLYRAVRYLARDAGIRQFVDLGSGLPTQNNVHQVARQFQPDTTVVYVDNDPAVQAFGRALLATDDRTTVLAADMRELDKILAHPDTQRLLDLSQPVAVLFLSVGHFITEDAVLQEMLDIAYETVVAGSYVAFTQMVGVDQRAVDEAHAQLGARIQMEWKNRLATDVTRFLRRFEPVEPGLTDITQWRPDPDQPPLPEVDEPLRRFVGASENNKRLYEFGGIARKPAS